MGFNSVDSPLHRADVERGEDTREEDTPCDRSSENDVSPRGKVTYG